MTSATCANLGFALSERLHELAKRHGRDATAEVRHPIRSYVANHEEQRRPAELQGRGEAAR